MMWREEWKCWQQQNNDGVIAEGRRPGMQICHSATSCWCEGDDNLHSLGIIFVNAVGWGMMDVHFAVWMDGQGLKNKQKTKFSPIPIQSLGVYSKVVLRLPRTRRKHLPFYQIVYGSSQSAKGFLFCFVFSQWQYPKLFAFKKAFWNVLFMLQLWQKCATLSDLHQFFRLLLMRVYLKKKKRKRIKPQLSPPSCEPCLQDPATVQIYQRLSQGWGETSWRQRVACKPWTNSQAHGWQNQLHGL